MELQEAALGASPPIGSNVGAPVSVAPRDFALHVGGDVARREDGRSDLAIRSGTDGPRPGGGSALRLLDRLQQQGERARDDGARITVRNLPPEKILKAAQRVVALLTDRELDAIALGRRRLDDRAVGWSHGGGRG
jgi:hypothetical protein